MDEISDPEVEITEEFLISQEELFMFSVYTLVQAALRTTHAVDTDVIAALKAQIQTYRTAQSGLLYETRSENLVAAQIQQKFSDSLANYEKERREREMLSEHRDSDIFKILVMLCRIGQQNLNGRPKGRMFIDVLRSLTPETGVDERAPSIIL